MLLAENCSYGETVVQ